MRPPTGSICSLTLEFREELMFDELLFEALSRPKTDIGDRKRIVGSSDLVCAFKAYHSKVNPKKRALKDLLIFSRGDGREQTIREAMMWLHQQGKLGKNTEMISQLELKHIDYPAFMAHLDITLMNQKVMSIVEVKSTMNLPDTLYPGWFYQGTFQVGLAKLAYPDKIIRCTILAVDEAAGQHRKYICDVDWQFDQFVFSELIEKAKKIHAAVRANDPSGVPPEPSLLCSKCEYAAECPAIWPDTRQFLDLSSHDDSIAEYAIINDTYNKAKKRREAIKNQLELFVHRVSGDAANTAKTLFGQSHVFDVKLQAREQSRVSSDKLKEKYPEVYADEEIWDKSSHSFLSVKARKDLEECLEEGNPSQAQRKKKVAQQLVVERAA